jgi:hypothetical protein
VKETGGVANLVYPRSPCEDGEVGVVFPELRFPDWGSGDEWAERSSSSQAVVRSGASGDDCCFFQELRLPVWRDDDDDGPTLDYPSQSDGRRRTRKRGLGGSLQLGGNDDDGGSSDDGRPDPRIRAALERLDRLEPCCLEAAGEEASFLPARTGDNDDGAVDPDPQIRAALERLRRLEDACAAGSVLV